jgi:hypothetical protein
MKKDELKQVLKPLIKECIKEVMFEDGVLSGIITEVAQGLGATQRIVETAPPPQRKQRIDEDLLRAEQERKQKSRQTRKKMLDAIGSSTTINGMNVFEGVEPMSQGGNPKQDSSPSSPLSGVTPGDSGVDISSIFSSNWKALAKG